jgi:RNA 2',3'-cyclic 3'-phosphodiesterase
VRLFVAVEIALEIRERLVELIEAARAQAPTVRFVRPEGLHVTLKFLGNVADERVDSIQRELSAIHASQFSLAVEGTGFFPDRRRARIYWVGLNSEPSGALAELAALVDARCARFGFEGEERQYTPHVTLARLGSGNPHRSVHTAGATLPHLPNESRRFGMMRVTEFHLYESHLHPKGAVYTKVASFPLSP